MLKESTSLNNTDYQISSHTDNLNKIFDITTAYEAFYLNISLDLANMDELDTRSYESNIVPNLMKFKKF